MFKRLFLTCMVLSLAGCARQSVNPTPDVTSSPPAPVTAAQTAPTPRVAQSNPEDKWVCRPEKLTGTNRVKRVCRLQSEIEAARREAGDMVRRAQRGHMTDNN